jgi:hypothetical protein
MAGTLRIFTIKGFAGHYPVGTAAVVVAKSKVEASVYLESMLGAHGLSQRIDPHDFEELPLMDGQGAVLCDGNY